jgi:hypothetical protein
MQQLSVTPIGRHGDLGCRHQFFVCQRPYWLAADNLSEELQPQAVEYLGSCLELDLDIEQRTMLEGLINQIKNSKRKQIVLKNQYKNLLDKYEMKD